MTVRTTDKISESTLIILQGECASINGSRFKCIGTPFATTCHIAFFMDKSRSIVVCAHLDEEVNAKQMKSIFSLFDSDILSKDGIDLFLIGGYMDEEETSLKVTTELLSLICCNEQFETFNVNLCLLFTEELNTQYTVYLDDEGTEIEMAIPKYQSIGYDLKKKSFISLDMISGQNIPHHTLRNALTFDPADQNGLRVIYDCSKKECIENGAIIEPFTWECPEDLEEQLELDDDDLVEMCSTSPFAEHDGFGRSIRAVFEFVLKNQPKDVFENGKAIHFESGIINLDLLPGDGDTDKDDEKELEQMRDKSHEEKGTEVMKCNANEQTTKEKKKKKKEKKKKKTAKSDTTVSKKRQLDSKDDPEQRSKKQKVTIQK